MVVLLDRGLADARIAHADRQVANAGIELDAKERVVAGGFEECLQERFSTSSRGLLLTILATKESSPPSRPNWASSRSVSRSRIR